MEKCERRLLRTSRVHKFIQILIITWKVSLVWCWTVVCCDLPVKKRTVEHNIVIKDRMYHFSYFYFFKLWEQQPSRSHHTHAVCAWTERVASIHANLLSKRQKMVIMVNDWETSVMFFVDVWFDWRLLCNFLVLRRVSQQSLEKKR